MRSESHDRRQELIEHVSNVDEVLGEIFLGNFLIKSFVGMLGLNSLSNLFLQKKEFQRKQIWWQPSVAHV